MADNRTKSKSNSSSSPNTDKTVPHDFAAYNVTLKPGRGRSKKRIISGNMYFFFCDGHILSRKWIRQHIFCPVCGLSRGTGGVWLPNQCPSSVMRLLHCVVASCLDGGGHQD